MGRCQVCWEADAIANGRCADCTPRAPTDAERAEVERPKKAPKVHGDTAARAVALREAGYSMREIAEELDISKGHASKVIARERDNIIRARHADGAKAEDLADEFNLSRARIHQIIKGASGHVKRALADDQVREVRRLHGRKAAALVAVQFGVARSTIEKIWERKTYRDVK